MSEKIKKIKINKDLCIGCGTCEALLPQVFKLDEDNKAEVVSLEATDEEIRQAVESCPTQAISVEEE